VAFAGSHSTRIAIDGRETVFADAPFGVVAWAPVPESRKVADGAILQLMAHGQGVLRIPAETLPESVTLFAEGPKPGSRGAVIPFQRENGALVFTVTPELSGRWIYAVP
ncbi:MAG TPA: hypothetical protein PLI07_10085, partial [Candidatus Hydrogenedentes bacterium]|nr:hypothetical protein [Candidatus Hydrogenedentota bacterium]